MFAQTYSFHFDPSQAETYAQFAEQVVVPDLRQQPGFQGMQFLVDRQSGRAIGISYWASEATAHAAAEHATNPPMPPEGVRVPETHNLDIAIYEVLLDQPTSAG